MLVYKHESEKTEFCHLVHGGMVLALSTGAITSA